MDHTGLEPRSDVHPDLCVALGAGVLASRLAGHSIERVLVDVSPYSFGISYIGERGGFEYPYCYRPIIRRNTPLPLTRTERYVTSHPYQTEVDIHVYQGDDDDALKNVLVGDFRVDGLTVMEESNEVLCRMRLDLDGILEVTAVEKRTGKSKRITIANATRARSAEEIAEGKKRIQDLYQSRSGYDEEEEMVIETEAEAVNVVSIDSAPVRAVDQQVENVLDVPGGYWTLCIRTTARKLSAFMKISTPQSNRGMTRHCGPASKSLDELLFFIEGKS